MAQGHFLLARRSIILPPDVCADGEIIIEIRRHKGKRVVCSEMGLFEFPKEARDGFAHISGPQDKEGIFNKPFMLLPIQPNPAKGLIRIYYSSPDERRIGIKLYDVSGRLVDEKIIKSKIGTNEVMLKPKGLSTGVYFVHIAAGDYKRVEKAILLR